MIEWLGCQEQQGLCLDCGSRYVSEHLFGFFGHHSYSVHVQLIIYGNKACPSSKESTGNRDILFETHRMSQVYMLLTNAVQPI